MPISLLPLSTEAPPSHDAFDQGLSWLEQELEATERDRERSGLAYEIGLLQERLSRDDQAAAQYAAASDGVDDFCAPVERLLGLLERRRSFRNMEPLLHQQARQARSEGQRVQAALARAWFLLLHRADPQGAARCLLDVLKAPPTDSACLLTLELSLRNAGEPAPLTACLERRQATLTHPTLRALLGLEAASLETQGGLWAAARRRLSETLEPENPATWLSLEQLEELGHRAEQQEWVGEALEGRARLLQTLLQHPTRAPQVGLRPATVTRDRVVDELLRCAEHRRGEGQARAALAWLNRAHSLFPEHPVAVRRLIEQAQAGGHWETAQAFIEDEIRRVKKEGNEIEAATLWFALGQHESGSSTEPKPQRVEQSLAAAPQCWVAHATRLNHLQGHGSPEQTAEALEALAKAMGQPEGRQRYWMLASELWAVVARDPRRAQNALEQAAAGASEGQQDAVWRLGRALAQFCGEDSWYEDCLHALLRCPLEERERATLSLETVRLALLQHADAKVQAALEPLAAASESRLLAQLVRAYAVPTAGSEGVLTDLSRSSESPETARALEAAAAVRLLRDGKDKAARSCLESLLEEDPANPTGAGLLAAIHGSENNPEALEKVLHAAARACGHSDLAGTLLIQAGLSAFRRGATETATAYLDAARQRGAGCAWPLADWCRRASTDSPWPRSEAREELLWCLQRGARSAVPGAATLAELRLAISRKPSEEQTTLKEAAGLFLLLVGFDPRSGVEERHLDFFVGLNADAERLTVGWNLVRALRAGGATPRVLEARSCQWALSSPSPTSALQWLLRAQLVADRPREVQARQLLASQLSGLAALDVKASAAVVEHLIGESPALLPPDSVAARLTNLEISPPGSSCSRRAKALEQALPDLNLEQDPLTALLLAYNQLAAGEPERAVSAFRVYATAYPEDPIGWEGLLSCARALEDLELLAEASAALGNALGDPREGAILLEQAAEVLNTRLQDSDAAEAALTRSLELDATRPSSMESMLELLRARGDAGGILEIVERGLEGAAPEKTEPLRWEQARALRELGSLHESLGVCRKILEDNPEHAQALALAGEICITLKLPEEATTFLNRLALSELAPADQRVQAGVAAFDLLDGHLKEPQKALQLLLVLHRCGLSSLSLRERLARSAVSFEAWNEAAQALSELMHERPSAAQREEAARLLLAIERDHRRDAAGAARAGEVLLALRPGDPDALDLALSGWLDQESGHRLLRRGAQALRQQLSDNPFDTSRLDRLAVVAHAIADGELGLLCEGAARALNHRPNQQVSTSQPERHLLRPRASVPDGWLPGLRDPQDHDEAMQRLTLLSRPMSAALWALRSPSGNGRTVRDVELSEFIYAWLRALGCGQLELHSYDSEPHAIRLMCNEQGAVLRVGSQLRAPLPPRAVAELVVCAYAERRNVQLALYPTPLSLDLLAAVEQVAGSNGAPRQSTANLVSGLKKRLSRRQRRALIEAVGDAGLTPTATAQCLAVARRTLDRVALTISGDPQLALEGPVGPQGRDDDDARPRVHALLAFAFSPSLRDLRKQWKESS